MRLRWAHIVVLVAVLAMLCGCGRRSRLIPAEKLSRIYYDMFLVDQWLRENPDARRVADTTLVYDPIFRRYGYTFEDYDRTVNYYLDRPEKFTKILDRAGERLRKDGDRMQQEADAATARELELDRYRRGYQHRDFSTDSLRWAASQSLWPVPDADTLAAASADTAVVEGAPADSAAVETVADTLLVAPGREFSERKHKELRELQGEQKLKELK